MASKPVRLPWLVLSGLGLLVGLWLGLIRMGWALPVWRPSLAGMHGPLMVAGFFGTLISLERAVALNRGWMYLAPGLSALGMVLLLALPRPLPAAVLLFLGSLVLVAVLAVIVRMQPGWHTRSMALAAIALALGNGLWMLGWPPARVVPLWAAFLVLTIAGERLELGRMLRLAPRAVQLYLGATFVYVLGTVLALFQPGGGLGLHAAGMLFLALWLLRYDIVRRTLRLTGLPRFIALCLLTGYLWMALAGLLGLVSVPLAGLPYDAFWHMVFLGFVFSMIFGHAPIIFPAMLGVPIPYSPAFYFPLALLHGFLALRVLGDVFQQPLWRQWGGMGDALTIVLFFLLMVGQIRLQQKHRGG